MTDEYSKSSEGRLRAILENAAMSGATWVHTALSAGGTDKVLKVMYDTQDGIKTVVEAMPEFANTVSLILHRCARGYGPALYLTLPDNVSSTRIRLPNPDAIDSIGRDRFAIPDRGDPWVLVHAYSAGNHFQAGVSLATELTRIYVDGMPVGGAAAGERANVVHMFGSIARSMTEEECAKRAWSAVREVWKSRILDIQKTMAEEDFVTATFGTAKKVNLLTPYESTDVLPLEVLRAATTYPRFSYDTDEVERVYGMVAAAAKFPTFRPVSRSTATAVARSFIRIQDTERFDWKLQMYAYLHRAVVYNDGLSISHWINDLVGPLTWGMDITPTLINPEIVPEAFDFATAGRRHVSIPVVTCDAYTLDGGPMGPVNGYEPWYYPAYTDPGTPPDEARGDPYRGTIIYPRTANSTDVIDQIVRHDDTEGTRDTAEALLRQFIDRFIPERGIHALRAHMERFNVLDYPELVGRSFLTDVRAPGDGGLPTFHIIAPTLGEGK